MIPEGDLRYCGIPEISRPERRAYGGGMVRGKGFEPLNH